MELVEETNRIQSFLLNQDPRKARNYIWVTVRDETKRIADHESLFIACLELALQQLDDELYLLPEEKFKLERVVAYLLVLIDGDLDAGKAANIFRNGKVRIKDIQKFFQFHIVSPLYADINVLLEPILHLAPNYEMSKRNLYGATVSQEAFDNYDVELFWEPIRISYTDYLARLASSLHKYRKYPFDCTVLDDVSVEMARDAYHLVKEGLRNLSTWSTILRQWLAWKFTHPRDLAEIDATELESLVDGVEYAQALKFNASDDEVRYIVDILYMIKSVAREMVNAEALLARCLRFHIHHAVQQLIQGDLTPLLHRLDKRNKPILPTLINIRSMAVDWLDGVEKTYDYREYSRKQGRVLVKAHPPRIVGPSSSQLFLLRMEIASLFESGSEVRSSASVFSKTDLEGADVEVFEGFYNSSFFFPYLLNYTRHANTMADFSCLWYREYFLELSKSVQFPIDVSAPWLLTHSLLTNLAANPVLIEKIFMVLDVYNDAAAVALYTIGEQYLYDEIEAEANLAIDQCIYLLGEAIYDHYKTLGASLVLDQGVRLKLEEIKGSSTPSSSAAASASSSLRVQDMTRLASLLSQHAVNLLGRTINVSFVLTQNITLKLRRDLDIAVRRFEANDARGLIELHHLLSIVRTTHGLLLEHLPQLDTFDHLLHEIDESFAPAAFVGRISVHLGASLATDLMPNFSYNLYTERFIPSPVAVRPRDYPKGPKQAVLQAAYGGDAYYKAFESTAKLSRGFFGRPHFEVLLTQLDAKVVILPMLLDQLQKFVLDKIVEIAEYLEALSTAIDIDVRVTQHARFSAKELFAHFAKGLRPLLGYDDLKPEVFQNFREIGNALVFFKDLSALIQRQTWRHDSVFHGILDLFPMSPPREHGGMNGVSTTRETETDHSIHLVNPAKVIVDNVLQARHKEGIDYLNSTVPLDSLASTLTAHNQLRERTQQIVGDHQGSLLRWSLGRIEEHLYQQNLTLEWSVFGQREYQRHLSALEHGALQYRFQVSTVYQAKSFARIWTQLVFLFCLDDDDDEDEDEDEGMDEDMDPDDIDDDMREDDDVDDNHRRRKKNKKNKKHGGGDDDDAEDADDALARRFAMLGQDQDEDADGSAVITNAGEFGHGFIYAGATFLHLLKQRPTYEVLDINARVCRAIEYDQPLLPVTSTTKSSGGNGYNSGNHGGPDQPTGPSSSSALEHRLLTSAGFTTRQARFYTNAQRLRPLLTNILDVLEIVHEGKASYTRYALDRTAFRPQELFAS